MKKLSMFFFVSLVLSGCNDKIYDVSYYSEHLDQAAKVVQQCKNGEISDENCKNANLAIKKDSRDKLLNSLHRH